jgi:hypothetical protein
MLYPRDAQNISRGTEGAMMTEQRWVAIRCVWAVLFLTGIAGVSPTSAADWVSSDVGSTGMAGTAVKNGGVWTVRGAGSDIWGTEDSFQYLHKPALLGHANLDVRLDDVSNTHPFAKAGLMLRGSLDPNAAAVIVSLKPNNEIEFMHRPTAGAQMVYDGGTVVSLPVWLQLSWVETSGGGSGVTPFTVTASISHDGTTWSALGEAQLSAPSASSVQAGAVVLSHDPGQLNTAHFEGLSMLPEGWRSTDIGNTGIRGSASVDEANLNDVVTIEGAGADIWGPADSFQFVHHTAPSDYDYLEDYQLLRIDNTHRFAKAGLMVRDGLAPDAVNMILDIKPDGGVEFMARTCKGCETQYLGGTTVTLPIDLFIVKRGNTFDAYVGQYANPSSRRLVGSVTLPLGPTFEFGFAVTSHDVGRLTTAVFDHPPT